MTGVAEVRVHYQNGTLAYVKVYSPFDPDGGRRAILKRWGLRWDSVEKCWCARNGFVRAGLEADLRAYGDLVIGVDETPTWARVPPPQAARAPSVNWADALLIAMPPGLRDKVYRAVVRVLHPDVGGDLELMQQLNGARDRIEGAR